MATEIEKTIDIDHILKQKMGSKAKFVPGILVSWLKKIVHQDKVNAFLWESRDKKGVEWLEECVRYLDMTLEIKGKEHLPDPNNGRLYTFVSNHPLGEKMALLWVQSLVDTIMDVSGISLMIY